ncbi:MAG: cold-shock protein [Pseudomonadota bacterium]
MATGKVKWFNNTKGYGFIRPDTGGDDLFVHYSYLNQEGYRTLKAGQVVEYDVKVASKGLHAVNVRAFDEDGNLEIGQPHPEAAHTPQTVPAFEASFSKEAYEHLEPQRQREEYAAG